jgi:hypothetical protein
VLVSALARAACMFVGVKAPDERASANADKKPLSMDWINERRIVTNILGTIRYRTE